jgi:hypothetical protein
MLINWIKKLFVKTSPVEPEVVAQTEPAPEKKTVAAKGKQGARRKRVENLKTKPAIRVGESKSNFKRRLERWKARNDSAKAKSNPRPNRPGVSSGGAKDPDQS